MKTTHEPRPDPDEQLERYLELCKRIYERMKANGTLEEVLAKVEGDRMAARYGAELTQLLVRYLSRPSHPHCVVCGPEGVSP